MDEPKYSPRRGFSVDEVARQYHLSRQRIYDEINAGRLPTLKVGTRRIITPANLDVWERAVSATHCAETNA